MKQYKHKQTQLIAKKGINKDYYISKEQLNKRKFTFNCCLDHSIPGYIIENSSDWEEIIEFPIGTKVKSIMSGDIFEKVGTAPQWKNQKGQYTFDFDESLIGLGKCFEIIEIDSRKLGEKVKPKEWEITAFADGQGAPYKMGHELYDLIIKKHLKEVGTGKECPWIHSVSRLSDNVEFEISNWCTHPELHTKVQIKSFHIVKDSVSVTFTNFQSVNLDEKLIKIEKLLTTKDGVDIFEGDIVYSIESSLENDTISERRALKKHGKVPFQHWFKDDIYFSSRNAMKEYIIENKPCLSLNDIRNNEHFGMQASPGHTLKSLRELIKIKL